MLGKPALPINRVRRHRRPPFRKVRSLFRTFGIRDRRTPCPAMAGDMRKSELAELFRNEPPPPPNPQHRDIPQKQASEEKSEAYPEFLTISVLTFRAVYGYGTNCGGILKGGFMDLFLCEAVDWTGRNDGLMDWKSFSPNHMALRNRTKCLIAQQGRRTG